MKTRHSYIAQAIEMTAGAGLALVARRSLLPAIIALTQFTLAQVAQAQCTTRCGPDDTAFGDSALLNPTGFQNSAFGYNALRNDSSGEVNTGIGSFALEGNFTGSRNTAVGYSAAWRIDASDNTAIGADALYTTHKGNQNTAIGSQALYGDDSSAGNSASNNTATGFQSLFGITSGYNNVANGWEALSSNTAGAHNTATGAEALYSSSADFNTAIGSRALYTNSSGNSNTASGYVTLYNNTTGSSNTAVGTGALNYNSTGSNNVAMGSNAGANLTTGNNNIDIGAGVLGNSADANVTRIGKTTQKKVFIGGIYNISEPTASGIKPVYINSTGQLGTTPPASSARFKTNVKPMEKSSEAILALKPMTFQYKNDEEGTPQFGLIAEEVAKVNPELVLRDDEGKVYTVRYEAVNAMLLNEFLKEHRKVAEQQVALAQQQNKITGQQSTIAELQSAVALQQASNVQQQKQIEALTAGLQKVDAQIQLTNPARQFAADSH